MTGGPAVEPQPVAGPLTRAAIFLVVALNPGDDSRLAVRSLCADFAALVRAVGFRDLDDKLSCVMAFGSDAWDRLFGLPRPTELHTFREIRADSRHAVSTPGDILFHIRAERLDLCFELATQIMTRLGAAVSPVDEVHGFRYFDARDLLGFVDGTENPEGRAAADAVLIGHEEPAFAGGSYVIIQKYVHDLRSWDALSTEEQELAIGRTKLSDLELPDEDKPPNSHLALNVIEGPDGEEQQIMRFNMPFGRVGADEYGTYYIAYARTSELIEHMLTNMFIGDPPGNTDRILDFSTALTGSLFFVPSIDLLEGLADADESDAGQAAVTSPEADPGDGSLRIGSLRDQPQ